MTLAGHVHVESGTFALDLDIGVDAGETVAIVGPNGAGKTTLVRALAGLRALSAGRIEIDGLVLDDPAAGIYLPPERRPIGMVFQEHRLFPHLSSLDNVAFGLRSRGMGRASAREEARVWLERVGLGPHAGARPVELSGGQAQRVALARALAIDPSVLLLDEPLAALDAATRSEVRRELRAHLATFPGMRLLVTHDPVDAAVLADRMLVIEGGRLVQSGTPAQVTARPRSPWAAEFAGTNLLVGTCSTGDRNAIVIEGGGIVVTAEPAPVGRVFVVVAPRAVSVHRLEPEGSPRNAWPARVRTLEPLGERVRVRVDGHPSIVSEVTSAAARALDLAEGVEVWVAVKATEVQVFAA